MKNDTYPLELSDDNLAYVLNRCHRSLMCAYESQKQIADEFLFVANLAKTTEELVKQEIERKKINNNTGDKKCSY